MSDKNEFSSFMDTLAEYSRRATARLDERKSSEYGRAMDGSFNDWVEQELLIDILRRLQRIEKVMFPKEK